MSSVRDLFAVFATNLRLARPEMHGQFVCPLCLRQFGGSADDLALLSRAHIWPQALGGRDHTLACKACNNHVGAAIEPFLVERERHALAAQGIGSIKRVELHFDDPESGVTHRVVTEMTKSRSPEGAHTRLLPIRKASAAQSLHALQKRFESGDLDGFELRLRYSVRANWRMVRLGYLHAAYLWLFHQLGYDWVFCDAATAVRQQLWETHSNHLDVCVFGVSSHPTFAAPVSLHIVRAPKEVRGFIVMFPGSPGESKRPGVWMPFPGSPYIAPVGNGLLRPRVSTAFEGHQVLAKPDAIGTWSRALDEYERTSLSLDGAATLKRGS